VEAPVAPVAKTRKQLREAAKAASAEEPKTKEAEEPKTKEAEKPSEEKASLEKEPEEAKSAIQLLYEKRLKALDERESALAEREKTPAPAEKEPEPKKKDAPGFKRHQFDWEKLGYNREETGELLDALDAAHDEIARLRADVDELRGESEQSRAERQAVTQARHTKVHAMMVESIEKSASAIKANLGIDVEPQELGDAFVKAVEAGLIDFNPMVDDPSMELFSKAWRMLNSDIVEAALAEASTRTADAPTKEKKSVPMSKPSGERKDTEPELTGKDRIKAILAKSNPNVPMT